MKRHINTAQMKEKGRNSSDQINKEEITSLPEREFSILIVTVLKRLENRMEKMQQAFNTVNTITNDIEEIKNKQTEMNNTINEIKNCLEGIYSRIMEAEEWISQLEHRMVEITAEEQNNGKRMKRIEFSLLGTLLFLEPISFPMLGKFSTIISSKNFSVPFFFSSSSVAPITRILGI